MSIDEREAWRPLIEGAAVLGIVLDDLQVQRFATLRDLLLDWNTRFNLTAITDPAEVITRHFLDSLTCALALPPETHAQPLALLDVGAGAGFPGLPLAIAFPKWRVHLLESTGKKVQFQEAVVAALALPTVYPLTGRAEDFARKPAYRAKFDVITARAVAALPTLLEYCAPLAKVGGMLIFPKKGDLAAEYAAGERAATLLGGRLLDPMPITLPPLNDGRVLVVARQERPCPLQYPRSAGAPVKRPLGS
ncbi:MAG: 16S rRNA (guanine(527)-N(7))-methyltransferase [Ktedonobacterales bacterium]|jgi:16S rRNA (guanine527-N7)-methyltransferase|nr:MAG: 16S rRNA (guanine(527)-N(7))-methyltransferase [Ktedonobacterales bacterium]